MNKKEQAIALKERDVQQTAKEFGYILLAGIACLIGGFVYWYSFLSVHATR